MIDKIHAHCTSAKIEEGIPPYDQSAKCPDHPEAEVLDSYGLAGGGFGVYNMCSTCSRVLSKSTDPEFDE